MKANSPKIKFYLTIAVVILVLSGVIFGAGGLILWAIKTDSEKIIEVKQQISNTEAKRSQLIRTEKEFDVIRSNLSRIDETLKDPTKFLDIIIELEKLAEQNNAKHQIIIVEETTKTQTSSPTKYLLFRIILSGTFGNTMNFISDLENANFYSQIGKIEMSKIDKLTPEQIAEGSQIGNIKTIMEVKIFTK